MSELLRSNFGPIVFRERFLITALISRLISTGRLLKDECERQHVTSTIHSAAIAHVAELLLAVNRQTDVVGDDWGKDILHAYAQGPTLGPTKFYPW